jgi:hypothetical protein
MKSEKANRKLAKEKAKDEKELAEVLEKSRLEAERGARELQALSSKPITPSPLLILGKQKLFVSDKHGNIRFTIPYDPQFDPFAEEREKFKPTLTLKHTPR